MLPPLAPRPSPDLVLPEESGIPATPGLAEQGRCRTQL